MQAFGLFGRLSTSTVTLITTTTRTCAKTAAATARITTLSRQFSSTSHIMAPISKETDFLVIGGGSGGLGAARMASKFGAKAMIIEASRLGGTCVNVGCVPKKIVFNAAAIKEAAHDGKAYGFNFQEPTPFDWPTFKKKRDAYIVRLNGIYANNLKNDNVEYVHGYAKVLSKNEVEITQDDGTVSTVRASKIVIAVGGRPASPPDIPGAEYGVNSNGFFDIDQLPKKVVLVGAGYIAVEFAGMFNALGVETHLFIRHKTFLRTFDPMIQDHVTAEYERLGVHVHKESTQSRVDKNSASGKLTLHYKDSNGEGSISDIDHLIWAIGRIPETDHLGLEKAGVELTDKGHVKVDEYQNTTAENIYALGDVCGKAELTPVAIAAGRRLAERLFGPSQFSAARVDYENIPSVVFAHPEVGSIGLTEPQAEAKYGKDNLKVYTSTFVNLWYAMAEPDDKARTKYKVICTGPEEKVVGLHILGMGSGEVLQGFGVAIKMGATKKDLDSCVAIHPTAAEELVTMR
ncbi:glutathione reductase [Xylariaceae sp. FL0255]|nr:glutathione reductase [Xylariaceae sp. FL0255]